MRRKPLLRITCSTASVLVPEVMLDEAAERISLIYEDIQRSLRVPFVNLILRSLANYSAYLESAWTQLNPILRT